MANTKNFYAVGALNTLFGLCLIYGLKFLGGFSDFFANLIGYALCVVLSYALNAVYVFHHQGPLFSRFSPFLLVVGLAYCANLICVLGVIAIGVDEYIAHAIGVVPYVACTYYLSRIFVFKSNSN